MANGSYVLSPEVAQLEARRKVLVGEREGRLTGKAFKRRCLTWVLKDE